jgi:hypothetical protein
MTIRQHGRAERRSSQPTLVASRPSKSVVVEYLPIQPHPPQPQPLQPPQPKLQPPQPLKPAQPPQPPASFSLTLGVLAFPYRRLERRQIHVRDFFLMESDFATPAVSSEGISVLDSPVFANAPPANAKDIPAPPNGGAARLPRFA